MLGTRKTLNYEAQQGWAQVFEAIQGCCEIAELTDF